MSSFRLVLTGLLLVGLIIGSGAGLFADEVPIPGLWEKKGKARVGDAFEAEAWTVSGRVSWDKGEEEGRLALALGGGAQLSRTITIPVLAGDKIEVGKWRGFLALDLVLPAGRIAQTEVQVKLSQPGTSRVFSERLRLGRPGKVERLMLSMSANRLEPGAWLLEIRSLGKGTALLTDLSLLRLPADPSQMTFAKSNGVNGPDRYESGALGLAGWTADGHAPLPVAMVRADGPAAKAGLEAGDIITAVAGQPLPRNSCRPGFDWFSKGHEAVLGRAVEQALEKSSPSLSLTVLRGDQERELKLRLEARKPLPDDFPFDQSVTPKLYDDLIDFVRRTRKKEGHWQNGGNEWIQTCFAGLALLGRRDERDAETIREIADWYLRKFPEPESFGNLGFWAASYSGIFMCEYYLASGDERVLPFIERSLRWIESGFHTSKWGTDSLGHGPSGLPYDQKALMAPASHVIVFEALAHKAGLQSRIWETLLPYMMSAWSDPKDKGHGAMGYNASYRDQDEFWSRSGLFVLASVLRGEKKHMREAMVAIMVARCSYMRNSHAYGNPGDVWGLMGLAAADPKAFREVMHQWRFSFGGAWEPGFGLRHTTAHMGSPYMGEEGLLNPSMAALLAVRSRGLFMLGATVQDRGWLKLARRSAPDTAIVIRYDARGQVELQATIPAAGIRYSIDGSPPTRKSALYEGPFALPDGGLVLARPVLEGDELGSVSSAVMGLPKAGWKILSAGGAADAKEARRRAAALIDDDPGRPWQPDRGQGAPEPPFAVVIDMAHEQHFTGLRFSGQHRPKKLRLAWGNSATGLAGKARDFELDGKVDRLDFGTLIEARYLQIEMIEADTMRFGEVDLIWPEIVVTEEDGIVQLATATAGLRIRVTDDGKTPDQKSKLAQGRLKRRKGQALAARVFDEAGRALGPLVLIP